MRLRQVLWVLLLISVCLEYEINGFVQFKGINTIDKLKTFSLGGFTSIKPLFATKKASKDVDKPRDIEFSRMISINQVPTRRPVLCRLLAKDNERAAISRRFDLPENALKYFSSNVTVAWKDSTSMIVTGKYAAKIQIEEQDVSPSDTEESEELESELDIKNFSVIKGDFETLLLYNPPNAAVKIQLDEQEDYDDEIRSDGMLDIGEIATQYLGMELCGGY